MNEHEIFSGGWELVTGDWSSAGKAFSTEFRLRQNPANLQFPVTSSQHSPSPIIHYPSSIICHFPTNLANFSRTPPLKYAHRSALGP